jgi:hypothetical protein
MRADIHDGPEHNTLQSEAGYIDARPLCQVDETSCNARPVHTLGSSCDIPAQKRYVRFSSDLGSDEHVPPGFPIRRVAGLARPRDRSPLRRRAGRRTHAALARSSAPRGRAARRHGSRRKQPLVPELTRSDDIKFNGRVSLRRHPHALSLPHRAIARPGLPQQAVKRLYSA